MPYTTINKSVSLMACSIVTITLWFLLMTSKSPIVPFVSWNIQKERKKKNEFQTLTHFRIHLYYLFDFRPISGRNFPNEYWTDTSTLHVPLLVAFDWPIRRFHSRDKKGLRFSFLFVCVFGPTNRSLSRQDIGTDVGLHHDHLVRIKEIKDGNRRLLFWIRY